MWLDKRGPFIRLYLNYVRVEFLFCIKKNCLIKGKIKKKKKTSGINQLEATRDHKEWQLFWALL